MLPSPADLTPIRLSPAPARRESHGRSLVVAQSMILLLGLLLVALCPPANGRMLALPLPLVHAGHGWLSGDRMKILGAGRWRGSIVLEGHRADLFLPALRSGTLLVASTFPGCGPIMQQRN